MVCIAGRAWPALLGGRGLYCWLCIFCLTDSTLFVGNLSFNVGEEDLTEFFSSAGHTVESVRIITSQGRSKG